MPYPEVPMQVVYFMFGVVVGVFLTGALFISAYVSNMKRERELNEIGVFKREDISEEFLRTIDGIEENLKNKTMKYKYKKGDFLEISMLHRYAIGSSSGHKILAGTVVEVVRESVFQGEANSDFNGKPSYICKVFNETDEQEILEEELCVPN